MQMTGAVIEKLDEDEIPVLLKTLNGLSEFFRGYQKKDGNETRNKKI